MDKIAYTILNGTPREIRTPDLLIRNQLFYPTELSRHYKGNYMRICPNCKLSKPITDFYSRRNKPGSSVYCKVCTSEQTIKRQQENQRRCIEYKGGSCVKCGYNKCQTALEFHHLDPTKKDFSIAGNHLKSFKNLKVELDKCILICSNCHQELHFSISN